MIQFEKTDGVGKITLNRPEKFHSFVREMALELQKTLEICEEDSNIRSVMITANGKAFCAGQDLEEAIDPKGPDISTIILEHYNPIIRKIRKLKKPVIAAVNGVAAGAGASLALSCDIVVASEKASFLQAFSKIGLVPDSGSSYFLPRLIGLQKTAALMMTAEKISAHEAEQIGMIYKVYSEEEFHQSSWQLAEKLAKMPTKALSLTKDLLNISLENNLEQQLSIEEKNQSIAAQTQDYNEGVQAFLEKRIPNFKGK